MGIVVIDGDVPVRLSWPTLNDNFAYLDSQIQAPVIAGYTQAFTSQLSVTVPGLTHQLASASLSLTVWDTTGAANTRVFPDTESIDPVTFDVTVTFGGAQTGILVIK